MKALEIDKKLTDLFTKAHEDENHVSNQVLSEVKRQKLSEKEVILQSLETTINMKSYSFIENEKNLKTIYSNIEDIDDQILKSQTVLSEKMKVIKDQSEKLLLKRKIYQELNVKNQEVQNEILRLESKSDENMNFIEVTCKNIKNLEALGQDLEESKIKTDQKIQETVAKLETLKVEFEKVNSISQNKKNHLEEKKEDYKNIKIAREDMNSLIDEKESKLVSISSEINELEREIEEDKKQISSFEVKMKSDDLSILLHTDKLRRLVESKKQISKTKMDLEEEWDKSKLSLEKMQVQYAELEKVVEEEEKKYIELEKDITCENEKISELNKQFEELDEKRISTQLNIKDQKAEYLKFVQEKNNFQTNIKEGQKRLRELTASKERLNQDVKNINIDIEKKTKEVKDFDQKIQEIVSQNSILKTQISEKNSSITKLYDRKVQNEELLVTFNIELKEQTQLAKTLGIKDEELSKEVMNGETQISALKESILLLKNENEEKENLYKENQVHNYELIKEVSMLQDKKNIIEEARDEILPAFYEESSLLEKQLNILKELESEVASIETEHSALKSKQEGNKKTLEMTQIAISDHQKRKSEIILKNEEVEAEIFHLKGQIKSELSSKKIVSEQNKELKVILERHNIIINNLSAELEEILNEKSSNDLINSNLKSEIDNSLNHSVELKNKIETLNKDKERLKNENNDFTFKRDRLSRSIEEKVSMIGVKQSEYKALKKVSIDLQNKLQRQKRDDSFHDLKILELLKQIETSKIKNAAMENELTSIKKQKTAFKTLEELKDEVKRLNTKEQILNDETLYTKNRLIQMDESIKTLEMVVQKKKTKINSSEDKLMELYGQVESKLSDYKNIESESNWVQDCIAVDNNQKELDILLSKNDIDKNKVIDDIMNESDLPPLPSVPNEKKVYPDFFERFRKKDKSL